MTSRPSSRWPSRREAGRPAHFDFGAGRGRHRVWGTALLSHGGLAVTLVGGEVPHIGAVAVSIPRPSRRDARRRSATTSVFTLVGHKEDEIARPLAAELARTLDRTTVVIAGVHIRRAGAADLARVFENAGRAMEVIVANVRAAARRPRTAHR
ncbi:MAG: hypothetical protein ABSD47_10545 [Candidatus Methylomirabilota bacterium]